MSAPFDRMDRPADLPSAGAVPVARALQPAVVRLPVARGTALPALPALVQRALPAIAGSAAALVVSVAAEYALRALSNRALAAAAAPLRRAGRPSVPAATRTIVTEWLTIERHGRRG